ENYEALKNGTAVPVAGERFEAFVRRNALAFKHAAQAPQGTDVGEKLLVYTSAAALDVTLGEVRRQLMEVRAVDVGMLNTYKPGVEVVARDGKVEVAADSEVGGGVVFS